MMDNKILQLFINLLKCLSNYLSFDHYVSLSVDLCLSVFIPILYLVIVSFGVHENSNCLHLGCALSSMFENK